MVQLPAHPITPTNLRQIFSVPLYAEVLAKTGGLVPEFVNPKYTDDTKTAFKKPTRLEYVAELGAGAGAGAIAAAVYTHTTCMVCCCCCARCMMQDYPKLLDSSARVGFVTFDPISFSPVKNSIEGGMDKQAKGLPPQCAISGEADLYKSMLTLHFVGCLLGNSPLHPHSPALPRPQS